MLYNYTKFSAHSLNYTLHIILSYIYTHRCCGGFRCFQCWGIRFGSVCLCLFPVRTNSPYWLSGCKRAWIKPKSKCMFYVFVVCYAFSGFPFLIELRKPFPLWPNDHFVLQPHRTEFQNIMPKTGQHLTVNLSENGYGGRITRTKKKQHR